MMFAPIFRTLDTPAVRAIVGSPARIYSSGKAPQNAVLPYITWFVVADQPFEHLSGPADTDSDTVQIDCWAGPDDDDELLAINLAQAVRQALDGAGQRNRVVTNLREPDTELFRVGLQADFIWSR